MIVLSAALVLVALVLLLLGVTGPGLGFVYASIVVSLAAIVLLLLSVLQRRPEPETDEARESDLDARLGSGAPRPAAARDGGLDVLDEPRTETSGPGSNDSGPGRPPRQSDRDRPLDPDGDRDRDRDPDRDLDRDLDRNGAGPVPAVGAVRVGLDQPDRDGAPSAGDEAPPLFGRSAPASAAEPLPAGAAGPSSEAPGGAAPARTRAPRSRTQPAATRAPRKLEPYRGPVVVLPERGRFHRPDCRYVRDVEGGVQLTHRQATGRRYAPCGVCKP